MDHATHHKTREELLTDGLIDLVNLSDVHGRVKQQNPTASDTELQTATLEVIRSLVSDGLFELGDRVEGGHFKVWEESLDTTMQKIVDLYVTHYDDGAGWFWGCWLNLTEKGEKLALSTDEGKRIAREVAEEIAHRGQDAQAFRPGG